jgi:hypothetical protein
MAKNVCFIHMQAKIIEIHLKGVKMTKISIKTMGYAFWSKMAKNACFYIFKNNLN